MSRLIDADALVKNFAVPSNELFYAGTVLEYIKDAPTLDAEPVVYCKDCAYCRPLTKDEKHRFDEYPIYCLHNGLGVLEHDFCSYGCE